jgi:pimeloyl-ACP methyl ester carboxylesterase
VTITNPDLVIQLGDPNADLNQARYTRYFLDPSPGPEPDAILILIPGLNDGAGLLGIMGENLVRRAFREKGMVLEVWAFDLRTNQLEDLEGVQIAEAQLDAQIALDWLFGSELGLTLHPALAAGPNRRAIFHNSSDAIPFLANWTPLVFSRDIDAVVEEARVMAHNANVFLGGHSNGTRLTARYASTDFDLSGAGPPEPGYAKLRGLVLLEGTAGGPPSSDQLDRIEDRFDGGLFHAVRTGTDSCVDGTPCTSDADCTGKGKGTCTRSVPAYESSPRNYAAREVTGIQAATDPDSGQYILQVDQGAPGNNAIAVVPELSGLGFIPPATVFGLVGRAVDDDLGGGLSVGWPGPIVGGLQTWQTIFESLPPEAFQDNGPAPTEPLLFNRWGVEQEAVSMERLTRTQFLGETNNVDWYHPESSGLSVTNLLPSPISQLISLDSSALSLDPPAGRGRRDIENLVEAANVDIPVICLGASNGFYNVPGWFVYFGDSIGTCTAPSCDGVTPRVVDPSLPNTAFPTLGGIAGGFEAHITEGYTHTDIVLAEDNAGNNVLGPTVDFIERNMQ